MDVGSSRTRDFMDSPPLSLSLAGVFRNASVEGDVEDEGSGGGGAAAEISSENTGLVMQGRSEEDEEGTPEEDGEDGGEGDGKSKKRKKGSSNKYHRHTTEQIRVMEALFRESPHPDEKQRQQLSKQLGLAPRQVKFWFQNRRTQIKAIQERHENSLLKTEIHKLREENQCMREAVKKASSSSCPSCGSMATSGEINMSEEQQLRKENLKLKYEIEKLRGLVGKLQQESAILPSTSSTTNNIDQESRSSLGRYTGSFGFEKAKISDAISIAMDELVNMAIVNDPLWVRSIETGREILNYDEYVRKFSPEIPANNRNGRSIEASRETGIVFLDISNLVQAFMDVNQWKDMFPGMISRAEVVDIISTGSSSKDGALLLMFAELQLLTPFVPTREVHFVRHCKQMSPDTWAIVDVSLEEVVRGAVGASSLDAKCRRRPSGCIIEDKANGHCKVTWVEHMEYRRTNTTHTLYRHITRTGQAFGARHWMATLRQQCERRVFSMATNVPTKDSNGVPTLAGRKSILALAHRMARGFCSAIGGSSCRTWTRVSMKCGNEMRVSSRQNSSDPGEPVGLILCAVASFWLPVGSLALFNFLREESRRSEWDVMSDGAQKNKMVNLVKGQNHSNSVEVHATKSKESSSTWLLQDSSTNSFESTVVFAPVDAAAMQSAMAGCNSSDVAVLPSGFSILPDGLDTRPPVLIASKADDRDQKAMEDSCGSLLTAAVQVLADASPAADSVDALGTIISCTVQNIKRAMQCDDGI